MKIYEQVPETITFSTEDRMRYGALGYDGNELMAVISGYDLEIKFNMRLINSLADAEACAQYGGNAEGSRIVMLLNQLPEIFTKQQAIQIGDRIGLSRSTITRHIRGDNDDPFTVKIKHGVYRKRL